MKGSKNSSGEERVARPPLSSISKGRTISPSPAGRSEQREAPKGATDHGTADSMLPGACRPCSSCCLVCAGRRRAGQEPCHHPGRFALCQTGWKWRRLQYPSGPPPTVPTFTNLPPQPHLPSRILCPLLPEVTSSNPLRCSPGPPTSALIWPQIGPSPALASLSPSQPCWPPQAGAGSV